MTDFNLSTSFSAPSASLFPASYVLDFLSPQKTSTLYYLTSQFTPVADCANRPFTTIAPDYMATETALRDYVIDVDAVLGCSHPQYISALSSTATGLGLNRFLAAPDTLVGVCPSGYTTVGTRMSSDRYQASTGNNEMILTNTIAYCCPSGFAAAPWDDSFIYFSCQSTITSPTILVQLSTKYEMTPTPGTKTYTAAVSVSSKVVFDRGYIVKWNEQQLQYFDPPSAPVLNAAAVTSFPSTMSTAKRPTGGAGTGGLGSSGGDDNDSDSSKFSAPKLSRKAIGAIVGGVIGGVLALIGLIIGLIRRKKHKDEDQLVRPTAPASGNPSANTPQLGELYAPLTGDQQAGPQLTYGPSQPNIYQLDAPACLIPSMRQQGFAELGNSNRPIYIVQPTRAVNPGN